MGAWRERYGPSTLLAIYFLLLPLMCLCVCAHPQGGTTMVVGLLTSCDIDIILIGLLQLLLAPLIVRCLSVLRVAVRATVGERRGRGREGVG